MSAIGQERTFPRHTSGGRARRAANLDLLPHQNDHEILADLYRSRVRLSRLRYQILISSIRLDNVRIHRESWVSLRDDLSGLLRGDVVFEHRLGSLGTYSRPLK